jgi:endo-alpha-1,4-polygalactosaminidase (GH114 family)
MLLLRIILVLSLLLPGFANATPFYGFNTEDEGHPLTQEERLLNIGTPPRTIINYREELRNNINELASFARKRNRDFIIIVHEGEELLYKSNWEYQLEAYNKARRRGFNVADPTFLRDIRRSSPDRPPEVGTTPRFFLRNINALAVNNAFCGDREPVRQGIRDRIRIISIDRCKNGDAFDEAVQEAGGSNTLFYGFIRPDMAFRRIRNQPIIGENVRNIFTINDASNISFLIDDSLYREKFDMIEDILNSNFDIVVIRPFFRGTDPFTREEIHSMKLKKSGPKRLIIAMQNITEANDNHYYWNPRWTVNNPSWIRRASFIDNNAVIVEYWNEAWKNIMSRFFRGIVDSGYDGAFLTGLQNHKYFERMTPLE